MKPVSSFGDGNVFDLTVTVTDTGIVTVTEKRKLYTKLTF